MQCEMCGRKGEVFRAKVEGVLLNVCDNCGGHGEVLAKVQEVKAKKIIVNSRVVNDVEDLVHNYSEIVKKAREARGWEHRELGKRISERESVIAHVENGKLKPTFKLARKLEKSLGVKLVYCEEVKGLKGSGSSVSGGLTIGDLLKK